MLRHLLEERLQQSRVLADGGEELAELRLSGNPGLTGAGCIRLIRAQLEPASQLALPVTFDAESEPSPKRQKRVGSDAGLFNTVCERPYQ